MLFCPELCSRNKCNLKASIQLIRFLSTLHPKVKFGKEKKLTRLYCWTLGVYWVACVGDVWPCALGTNMLHAWKQLVNLGAKLIELKISQFLISGLNQYQLIPKYGRAHSTCIMLVFLLCWVASSKLSKCGGEN